MVKKRKPMHSLSLSLSVSMSDESMHMERRGRYHRPIPYKAVDSGHWHLCDNGNIYMYDFNFNLISM